MNPLNLTKLDSIMTITSGIPEITIGIIDGPVDFTHPDFQESQFRTAKESQYGACRLADSLACTHGTFVTGILAANRGSSAAAICPRCDFVIRPIFSEIENPNGNLPTSTPSELARAIKELVKAGAKIINLSLGLSTSSMNLSPELDEAYAIAQNHEVIIVAASGNQGIMGNVPLVECPWIIPVVACDEQGSFVPESNIGPSIGQRGVMAPGSNIISTAPDGNYTKLSGTSVATPFVTGAIALLWSGFPQVSASDIRSVITSTVRQNRRTLMPPILDAVAAWRTLETKYHRSYTQRKVEIMANENVSAESYEQASEEVSRLGEQQVDSQNHQSKGQVESSVDLDFSSAEITRFPQGQPHQTIREVVPVQAHATSDCPTCGGKNLVSSGSQNFVYALGTIETPRFPNLSVEKQFAQEMKMGTTDKLTDREVFYNILKANRYLATEVCWPYTIDGLEAYLLVPRDPFSVDHLIEAMKPTENRQLDRDVVIGIRGPIAPIEMCNGLMVPIVIFDRIYSFDIPTLIKSIPRPENMEEKIFRSASEEVFNRIAQLANNVGAMDEHRAVNYLVMQYPAIYSKAAEMYVNDFSLTRIESRLSRVSVGRKIIDIIFTFENRKTYFKEQYFAAVDVTEKWPFLVRPLGLYLET